MKRLLLLALIASTVTAQADKWRFIVTGDGRAWTKDVASGINETEVPRMAPAIVAEKPEFILYSGDLVMGDPSPEKTAFMLESWRVAFSPVLQAKIPVFAVRGNHEAQCTESVRVWNEFFNKYQPLPGNGPAKEKGLTYYVQRHNALMVGLDHYGGMDGRNSPGAHKVDLGWFEKTLKENPTEHVFVYGHENAFVVGGHKDCLNMFPAERDRFIDLLWGAGGRTVLAGHEHFFEDTPVTSKTNPEMELRQIIAGTAGAPFYKDENRTGNGDNWVLGRHTRINETFGYVVVEVDGPRVLMVFKGRAGEEPGYTPKWWASYTKFRSGTIWHSGLGAPPA